MKKWRWTARQRPSADPSAPGQRSQGSLHVIGSTDAGSFADLLAEGAPHDLAVSRCARLPTVELSLDTKSAQAQFGPSPDYQAGHDSFVAPIIWRAIRIAWRSPTIDWSPSMKTRSPLAIAIKTNSLRRCRCPSMNLSAVFFSMCCRIVSSRSATTAYGAIESGTSDWPTAADCWGSDLHPGRSP